MQNCYLRAYVTGIFAYSKRVYKEEALEKIDEKFSASTIDNLTDLKFQINRELAEALKREFS